MHQLAAAILGARHQPAGFLLVGFSAFQNRCSKSVVHFNIFNQDSFTSTSDVLPSLFLSSPIALASHGAIRATTGRAAKRITCGIGASPLGPIPSGLVDRHPGRRRLCGLRRKRQCGHACLGGEERAGGTRDDGRDVPAARGYRDERFGTGVAGESIYTRSDGIEHHRAWVALSQAEWDRMRVHTTSHSTRMSSSTIWRLCARCIPCAEMSDEGGWSYSSRLW